MGNIDGGDAYDSYGLSIHTKPSAWGADNSDNGETIVEDNAECKDQSGKDNGNEDNNGNTTTQSLPIKDCDNCSSSKIIEHSQNSIKCLYIP